MPICIFANLKTAWPMHCHDVKWDFASLKDMRHMYARDKMSSISASVQLLVGGF